jgi:hypothetical protein
MYATSTVPPGLGFYRVDHPALKRWAKLLRAYGAADSQCPRFRMIESARLGPQGAATRYYGPAFRFRNINVHFKNTPGPSQKPGGAALS